MSTADEALAAHRELLADIGEDIVIRRYTGTGTPRPKLEATTRARILGGATSELVGSTVQTERKIVALVDNLSNLLPIMEGDRVLFRDRDCRVMRVDDDTRRINGVLIALELTIKG